MLSSTESTSSPFRKKEKLSPIKRSVKKITYLNTIQKLNDKLSLNNLKEVLQEHQNEFLEINKEENKDILDLLNYDYIIKEMPKCKKILTKSSLEYVKNGIWNIYTKINGNNTLFYSILFYTNPENIHNYNRQEWYAPILQNYPHLEYLIYIQVICSVTGFGYGSELLKDFIEMQNPGTLIFLQPFDDPDNPQTITKLYNIYSSINPITNNMQNSTVLYDRFKVFIWVT